MASIRIQTQTEPETPPTDKVVIYIDVADGILTSKDSSAVVSKYLLNSPALNAMTFKGVIDCSANPNYPAADAGDTYKVSVAGKIGGASGVNVEAGDILLCIADGTVSGNQATVGMYWSIEQANIDGAVIGPASAVNNRVVFFDGTSGKLIKDSGLTLSGSNSGDQTSIVGITGTKAQFNTACTDGAFVFIGGVLGTPSSGNLANCVGLTVPGGGTGVATLTDAGVLIGNGAGAIQVTTPGTVGQVLTSNGPGVDPTFQTSLGALSFTSTDQTITSAGLLTIAHGLGSVPKTLINFLICQTAEFGYTAGDIVLTNNDADEGQDTGMAVIVDATNVLIRYGAKVTVFKALHFTTGIRQNLTNANWKLRVIVTV
jgi:hypothetical protein